MQKLYNAVILGGGKTAWLKEEAGTDIRCLAKINNKRILDYLVEALQATGRIKEIMVAVPKEALPIDNLPAGVQACSADIDMPSTAVKAAELFCKNERVFFICDDIPLITPQAIEDFLEQCEACPDKQVFYPAIPKEVCLEAFPNAKRTYGKLADGAFTGGNMMVIDYAVLQKGLAASREIFAKRKNPLALCSWLGFSFIIKLLLGMLDTAAVEKRTSELLDMPCKVIISRYAEVGMDADKPEDWQLMKKYLTK